MSKQWNPQREAAKRAVKSARKAGDKRGARAASIRAKSATYRKVDR